MFFMNNTLKYLRHNHFCGLMHYDIGTFDFDTYFSLKVLNIMNNQTLKKSRMVFPCIII